MPASSILPVAQYKNKLYFLFGKENPLEDTAHGFSDFGGGIDKGETPFETAVREGAEELTGFLGNPSQIRSHIKKHGGVYKITRVSKEDPKYDYHVNIVHYDYDPNLPEYYNNNHMFLWNRMDKKILNKTKLFEKIEIDWFCEDELLKRKSECRWFYKDVVDKIVEELPNIRKHIKKCEKKSKTRRNRKRDKCTRKIYRGGR